MSELKMDVVVIGGGSSGLSAALTLGRMRRRILVLDGGEPRNRTAGHMHGLLGRDHTSPLDLLADGRRELQRYGVSVRPEPVSDVRRVNGELRVRTPAGDDITTRRLLVATGLRDELPDIDGMAEQWGRGVVTCPYCDGWEVRDQRIGVLATSAWGAHQAHLLRLLSDRVTHFTDGKFTPEPDQAHQITARGIAIDDRPVRRVVNDGQRLVGVELDGGTVVELDILFVGPRMVPQDALLTGLGAETVEKSGARFVATDATGKTSVPGVWAAGNVVEPMANVPVAIAAGVTAAVAVNADLLAEETALAAGSAAAS